MLAVIKTGGKQYIVSPGQKIKIETLRNAQGKKTEVGEQIEFSEVLLLQKNKKLEIGTPYVKDAKVIAKITGQGRAKKIIVFKYKPKKRYKKKKGHRQPFTEVEITKI